VGGIKGVDEGVDSSTVSARRNNSVVEVGLVASRLSRGESGTIGVELEVPVGGVMGVDERVEVGVNRGINVVIINRSLLDRGLTDGSRGRLTNRGSLTDRGSLGDGGSSLFRAEGSRVESVGSGGHVIAVEDSESILASRVLHSVGFPVISNVAVLSNTLAGGTGLLPEDDAILLGIGGTEPSVSSVESLLLQDLGVLRVNTLTGGGSSQTRYYDKLQHIDGLK